VSDATDPTVIGARWRVTLRLQTRSWVTPAKDGESSHHQLRVFPQAAFDFLITAFVTLVLVKQVNRLQMEAPFALHAGPLNEKNR